MDKTLAARRLSAALGMAIKPEMVKVAYDGGLVQLHEGAVFSLAGGNAAYRSSYVDDHGNDVDGFWIKNGRIWNIAPGERVRPLPEEEAGTTKEGSPVSSALERYRARRPQSTPTS